MPTKTLNVKQVEEAIASKNVSPFIQMSFNQGVEPNRNVNRKPVLTASFQ